MSKANEITEAIESLYEQKAEAGFDLTDISGSDWKEVLKEVGIKSTKPKRDNKKLAWVWKGSGIEIRAQNNPITGEYFEKDRRGNEKDYASRIGIEGEKELVKKAFDKIKELGNSKEADPKSAQFV